MYTTLRFHSPYWHMLTSCAAPLYTPPQLYLPPSFWQFWCLLHFSAATKQPYIPQPRVFPPWPVAMWFATMHNSAFQKHYTFLFLPSLVFSALLFICTGMCLLCFDNWLLYLLQLKKQQQQQQKRVFSLSIFSCFTFTSYIQVLQYPFPRSFV